MSLLMDALRKAEEAKRNASQNPSPPSSRSSSLQPLAVAADINSDLELSLEALTLAPTLEENSPAGYTATSDALYSRTNPDQEKGRRQAVRNTFAAKNSDNGDHTFLLALASLAVLTLIGVSAYLWWQTPSRNTATQSSLLVSARPAAGVAAGSANATATAAAPLSTLPPFPTLPAAQLSAGAHAGAADEFEVPPLTEPGLRQPRLTTSKAGSPIRIAHGKSQTNPLLEQGYAALQKNQLPLAQQAYERVLAAEPHNIDALYGLAAIAVARQQTMQAEDYYLRILEADPRDALAHAGLSGLNGRGGSNLESRLKGLIAEQPNIALLHFALGNVYAQAQRWRDAQQAYFTAYRNGNDIPDVAFNLAVSLDQLHQDKLAVQYYGEALQLATQRAGNFNQEQARQRLRELQGQQ